MQATKAMISLCGCAGWFRRSLRKHAYSNTYILKISPPKTESFQIKVLIFIHISVQNIDCWYSLEPPRRGGSNEYSQSMFLSLNKKNNVYPCKSQFYYIKVGFKVGQHYIDAFSWCVDSLHILYISLERAEYQGHAKVFRCLGKAALLDCNISSVTLRKHACSNILKILPPRNEKKSDKKFWYFSYFCSKHRLWVLVRTASRMRF